MWFFLQALTKYTLLPLVSNGIQALWHMIVIIPLLSMALMGNPMEPKSMDLVCNKNAVTRKQYFKAFLHTAVRFCVPIPICLVLYVACLAHSGVAGVTWGTIWGGSIAPSILSSPAFQAAVVMAQSITHFICVFYLVILSLMHIHRFHSMFTILPCKNWVLPITLAIVLVFQAAFSVVSCVSFANMLSFPQLPVSNFFFNAQLTIQPFANNFYLLTMI